MACCSTNICAQEQDDAREVIAWIARQPWCSGAVGMMGISWGGFNALQVAARRPPALKAIISHCSTDDRYADDVDYIGGCVLAHDMLVWSSRMLAINALPPDPRIVGERWREMWLDRLAHTPPYIETWLAHQRRDDYWRHGSVCEDYAAIACAVYAIGGWMDGYVNAVPRLLAGLPGPRKGLIGPWAHTWPEHGAPAPAIGFLQEALRWWDYWLKGIDTGVMDEPMLRAWMPDTVVPGPQSVARSGRWIAEPSWPTPNVTTRRLMLNALTLDPLPGEATTLHHCGMQTAGLDAGSWCPYDDEPPPDQRAEDGLALAFTSVPLAEPLELLGAPEVTLTLAADRACAVVAVRLCAVAPGGASTLLSRGFLNLTHREGHEHPLPLVPGAHETVTIPLKTMACALPAGHRLRLAVSSTYWPWLWPSPEPVTLSVITGAASYLSLPVRPPTPNDDQLTPFGEPEWAHEAVADVVAEPPVRTLTRDLFNGLHTLQDRSFVRTTHHAIALTEEHGMVDTYRITEDDPLSAAVISETTQRLQRGAWSVRIETRSTMTADRTTFHLTNTVDAYDGEEQVYTMARTCSIPRDLV